MPFNAEIKEASVDLEEALKENGAITLTEEELELVDIGFLSEYVIGYKRAFPDEKLIYNHTPINDFFKWYLINATSSAMELLSEEANRPIEECRLRDSQVDKVREWTAGWEGKPDEGSVAMYIEKNQELILENDKLKKQLNEIMRINEESGLDKIKELGKQNDGLYKKIQALQGERDGLEGLVLEFVSIFQKNEIKDEISDEIYNIMMRVIQKHA